MIGDGLKNWMCMAFLIFQIILHFFIPFFQILKINCYHYTTRHVMHMTAHHRQLIHSINHSWELRRKKIPKKSIIITFFFHSSYFTFEWHKSIIWENVLILWKCSWVTDFGDKYWPKTLHLPSFLSPMLRFL